MSKYEELRKIDVHKLGLVEKKGKLDYISWAGAWDLLAKADESAVYTYDEARVLENGTVIVSTTVSALGKVQSMIMPVINYNNKAIPNPDAFQVNTAYQRCLAKNIAVISGIGLSLYLGEVGVNEEEEKPKKEKPLSEEALEHYKKNLIIAHENGNLKKEFFTLPNNAKEQLRDFANELRAS